MITIEHECKGHLPGGFFSKFLIVLDWVHNSIYKKEKVYVDWTCEKTLDYNLWDFFFEQPNLEIDETNRTETLKHYRYEHRNLVYENIDQILPMFSAENGKLVNKIHLFERQDYQSIRDEFHKAWKLIKIKSHVIDSIKHLSDKITERTLGVTVRIPKHYSFGVPEGPPLSTRILPEKYYKLIITELFHKMQSGNYDNIFIACDVQYFIDLAISVFGSDKVIYTNYPRLKTLNEDWVEKKLPLQQEYSFILRDGILLSKCNNIIGGSSNIFTAALYMNNKSKFQFFDTLKGLYGC